MIFCLDKGECLRPMSGLYVYPICTKWTWQTRRYLAQTSGFATRLHSCLWFNTLTAKWLACVLAPLGHTKSQELILSQPNKIWCQRKTQSFVWWCRYYRLKKTFPYFWSNRCARFKGKQSRLPRISALHLYRPNPQEQSESRGGLTLHPPAGETSHHREPVDPPD